jgi:hypothetical protein
MVSESLRQLRGLTEDELIERHDTLAKITIVSSAHYLAELARRDLDRQTTAMLGYTRRMHILTVVILCCTIVNTVAVLASLR